MGRLLCMESLVSRASVAAEIRAELGRQNLAQKDLAAATGIKAATLSRRLAGTRALPVEEFTAICRALSVDVADIIRRARGAA